MITILKKPLVTEKASLLNEKNMYGFIVDKRANKIEIKKAVAKLYGVTVVSVNTMQYAGKKITRYRRSRPMHGQKAGYKKAIVTLKAGEVLDLYGEVQ